ncbi:MAG TPA: multicopper oxidase domain-containing protein [Thermoleophilaceae bacterium]|nr:multicopper oxidase domain-containing protein [Thermoleophilaceae bacterium]
MSDSGKRRLSRRRLLGGAAAGTAALPILHELIPHRGVHGQDAAAQEHAAHRRVAGHNSAAHRGSGHIGAVGKVNPRVNGFDPVAMLRDFDEGTVKREGGRTVREWQLVAEDIEIEVAPGVKYAAWAYNRRVPGPTLRAKEGERLRVRFINGSRHPHTIHFHGIHRDVMDGIPGVGAGNIEPGQSTTYEFDAEPFGLHLYHCHSSPLAEHIAKGLYGAFVIDPKKGRPKADELVMVMNGFDTNFDRTNEIYAVNTVAFEYMHRPVKVKRDQLVRIYLVNALEFDLLNSFHVHANFFDYYPTGTKLEPRDFTDTVVQGQGERGILEMRFPYTGKYMFHAHVSEFAELGWMGFFEVED